MVCAFAKTENPASDLVLERMLGGKKYFFLRNEANKSYEINRKVVRQGETKPLIGGRKQNTGVRSQSRDSNGAGQSRSLSRQGGIGMT